MEYNFFNKCIDMTIIKTSNKYRPVISKKKNQSISNQSIFPLTNHVYDHQRLASVLVWQYGQFLIVFQRFAIEKKWKISKYYFSEKTKQKQINQSIDR